MLLVFTVPKICGPLDYQSSSRKHFVAAIFGASCCLHLAFVFAVRSPKWIFIVLFLFWRLAYNVGLGYILKKQGKDEWFTEKVSRLAKKNSFVWKSLRSIMSSMIYVSGQRYALHSVPIEFTAWLAFRLLVDIILFHDFIAFCTLSLAYADFATASFLVRIAGIILIVLAMLVKIDAYRVTGDSVWYWENFFFRRLDELTFLDGIYELIPHPMYSLGYGWYYGMTLLAKSYTVFYMGLGAHFSQLLFLVLIELPHVKEKEPSYGWKSDEAKSMNENRNDDMVLLSRIDFLKRPTDVFVWIIFVITLLLHTFGSFNTNFVIFECISWRLIYMVSFVLYLDGQQRHIITCEDAETLFFSWKCIYNLLMLMDITIHILAALYVFSFEFTPLVILRFTLSMLLVGFQILIMQCSYTQLGSYGWFYGDFFHSPNDPAVSLVYSGIYHYVNDPMLLFGRTGYFGLALLCWDFRIFVMALLSVLGDVIIWMAIEEPHKQKIYGRNIQRHGSAHKFLMKLFRKSYYYSPSFSIKECGGGSSSLLTSGSTTDEEWSD